MVLDKAYDVVFLGEVNEFAVVLKELDSWLRHQDMYAALNRIFRNGVVGGCNGVSNVIGVNRYFKRAYYRE